VTEPSSGKGKRRALGRGLDALIPSARTAGLLEVETDRIEPNPDQPRHRFDTAALDDLAASIKQHGIVQPLLVSAIGDDRFRIIVGERRWRAAMRAGLERVPVVLKETTDRHTLELALIENVQRADLNSLEEAHAYQRLIQDFGLTQNEVGKQVGKSRVAVTNTLRLLLLPEAARRAVLEQRITEGHARALLALPDVPTQLAMLERIEREGLNVRQTEERVRRLTEPRETRTLPEKNPDIAAVEDTLRQALGTRVSIRHTRRGGRIVIDYYSDDEFQGLYDRLTRDG
jgi:ParB family transcriptional regulator, chromosome partitioning protein